MKYVRLLVTRCLSCGHASCPEVVYFAWQS